MHVGATHSSCNEGHASSSDDIKMLREQIEGAIRQGVGVAVKIYNIDQNPLAGNEFRDTRMQCAWCQAIAFELTSCCVQVLVILL